MAEGDDSFVSTPVVLAATFGAAAVLIGILYTLKADKVETKVALPNGKARNSATSAHPKHKKGQANDKARRSSDAMQRRSGPAESTSVEVAEGTTSKRKKRNGAASAVNSLAGKDEPDVAAQRAVPTAREPAPTSTPPKQQRTQQTTEDKQSEGGPDSADGEDGGVGADAAAGSPSKTARRKQRKKNRKPACESPASSSSFGTAQTSAAGADGGTATPPSAASASTAGDDTPREDGKFTIVSKRKSSRKKANANAGSWVAASSGNSTPNLASSASGSPYGSGRFNILANDSFAR